MGRLQKRAVDWIQILKIIFNVIRPLLKERLIFLQNLYLALLYFSIIYK